MKRFMIILTMLLITTAMILTACSNQNSSDAAIAEITKVAQTVQFQLTESSKLTPSATPTLPATATPIPVTNTPTGPSVTPTETAYPTLGTGLVSGDSSLFVADVNYPDGTVFTPGTQFTKTWLFTNNGSTTWNTNYKLVYAGGSVTDRANKLFVNLTKEVKPGESAEISVDFTAPSTNGSYNSMWNLYSADGKFFGEYCSITFSVGATAATVAVTPYATVTP